MMMDYDAPPLKASWPWFPAVGTLQPNDYKDERFIYKRDGLVLCWDLDNKF